MPDSLAKRYVDMKAYADAAEIKVAVMEKLVDDIWHEAMDTRPASDRMVKIITLIQEHSLARPKAPNNES